jgi:sialate O-acetylesterase
MNVGGPFTMVISGTNSIRLQNVMVGDVWICSGQSNMTFELKKTTYAAEDVAGARNPMIRLYTVPRVVSETLRTESKGQWTVCTPEQAEDFSAVGYFFGKALQESLGVAIGLVHVSWGGTAAEGWVSRGLLESNPEFSPILDRWNRDVENYPAAIEEFTRQLPALTAKWKIDSVEAVQKGRALPRKPTAPRGPGHRDTPSGQFYGMLTTVIPFAMRGVIWYQGEGNASRAEQYRTLFPALIAEWRSLWKQGEFPFYFVQLPNLFRQPEPSKSGWAELREAQLMTLSVPNTGMAVTIDVGDPKDLHPTNKRPVGERLARAALASTYGKRIASSGPVYSSMKIVKNSVVITMAIGAESLTARGGTLSGFTIAGNDKKFVPADAVITGNTITVSAASVQQPAAVRYGWADNPNCTLYNNAGLPASPFRTDRWPEVTAGKR